MKIQYFYVTIILIMISSFIACRGIKNDKYTNKLPHSYNVLINGNDYNGYSGNFSSRSDVFKEKGIRISPFILEGRVYFDFLSQESDTICLIYQYCDNGWISANKFIEIYNWQKKNWSDVYCWTGNDKKVHTDSLQIFITPLFLDMNKVIRIGFKADCNAVIHLNSIKVSQNK